MKRPRILVLGALAAVAAFAVLASACGGGDSPQAQGGAAPYPLARPDSPVTLPIKDSNPAIAEDSIPRRVAPSRS